MSGTRYGNELRYLGLVWCLLCAVGATIGGVIGIMTWRRA